MRVMQYNDKQFLTSGDDVMSKPAGFRGEPDCVICNGDPDNRL